MSVLSKSYFHNEEAAFRFVEGLIWSQGPVCPHCGGVERISAIKPNPEKRIRHGLKKCGQCKSQFTVRMGTIFQESKLPLHKWLQAIYLMCSSKKGISAKQLERTLEVTYKTAWFLAHRIREAMADYGNTPMGGEGVALEIDETFIGRPRDIFANGRGWMQQRGTGGFMKVVSLVERGGRARSIKVENLRKDEIVRAMESADRKSALYTDEAQHYRRLGTEFASHGRVEHGKGEYGRGSAHTNTVEGFFSIFKRGMKGVYQHCSEKHLHRYLAEFDFRYSNRSATGCEDQERALRAIIGGIGKRLTYRRPDGGLQAAEA